MPLKPTVSVIVPVYRGEALLPRLLASLRDQSLQPVDLWLVVTDSNPEVETLARSAGAHHIGLDKSCFDHAGTRTEAASRAAGDVLVFLTQDVLPAGGSTLETLIRSLLTDNRIGAAYGRQIPDENADPVATIKRLFNYPDASLTKSADDGARFGLRTPFISNAFAAYRRTALEEIGWFGDRELICEDVRAGARLLANGWSIRYEADAVVHHTHHFGFGAEFRRYFDIGVAHHQHRWILDRFGSTDRQGIRYLGVGLDHLKRRGQWTAIPPFLLRGLAGRVAYFLGRHHRRLPLSWRRSLSAVPLWWDRVDTSGECG